MELKIRRFDKTIPLPEYKTKGAAAMDLSPRIDVTLQPNETVAVPLNVAIEPPQGHFVLMAGRSSLYKRGLMMANGIGIIDEDYAGNGDEYLAILRNVSENTVEIKKGERIVQIIVLPYNQVALQEVDELTGPTRGGVGSTGI